MATWVDFKKVQKFPFVVKAYARAGGGMGNVTGVAKRGFVPAVKRAMAAGSSWVRRSAGVSRNDGYSNVQIDVAAIPGVRALTAHGRKAGILP